MCSPSRAGWVPARVRASSAARRNGTVARAGALSCIAGGSPLVRRRFLAVRRVAAGARPLSAGGRVAAGARPLVVSRLVAAGALVLLAGRRVTADAPPLLDGRWFLADHSTTPFWAAVWLRRVAVRAWPRFTFWVVAAGSRPGCSVWQSATGARPLLAPRPVVAVERVHFATRLVAAGAPPLSASRGVLADHATGAFGPPLGRRWCAAAFGWWSGRRGVLGRIWHPARSWRVRARPWPPGGSRRVRRRAWQVCMAEAMDELRRRSTLQDCWASPQRIRWCTSLVSYRGRVSRWRCAPITR